MKKNKGFTLIELLISITLLSILLIVFTSTFVNGIKTYRKEARTSTLQNENRIALDRIILDTKRSFEVETTSTSNALYLKLPAVDANENLLYEATGEFKTDSFTYTINGNELIKTITPDAASSRNTIDRTILENVSNLTFTYFPDVSGADEVEINLVTTDVFGKETIIVNNRSRAKLRNK